MAKEALEDIILKSVEDASGCVLKGKRHKAHFLVNEDDAQQYLILLRNYYMNEDARLLKNFCREVHKYLMGITEAGCKKQVVVNGTSAFKSFENYDEQDTPEVNFSNETFHSSKDDAFAEKIKNASLGTLIASAGFYAITQNSMALTVGIPALAVHGVSRLYVHFITKKNVKKKGELMAANAFLEEADFMLVKDVLDENKDKIRPMADTAYISPV